MQGAFAQDLQSKIDFLINDNPLSKSAVVSVKVVDVKTQNTYAQKDSSLLLHPASTMKVATSAVVLSTLGSDYRLKTSLYAKDDTLYLKLIGDPSLKSSDLQRLFKGVNLAQYHTLVVDNTAIDNEFYDKGWMWNNLTSDDNPPYGIYNLNHNLIPVKIIPDKKSGTVQILSEYPFCFVNELILGSTNCINADKAPWRNFKNPEAIYFSGSVIAPCIVNVAVQNPEDYFLYHLHKAMPGFCGQICYGNISNGAVMIAEHQTPLMGLLSEQNKKSNNLYAQTLFKIAAHEAYQTTGTFDNAMKLFNGFYANPGMVVCDASGLSHYNLLNCDFLCNVLLKMMPDKCFRSTLAESGKYGTLNNRLKDVNLQGKTGTIAGVSGLCGYIRAKSGNEYIFAILIQNYKGKVKSAKELEDSIIRAVNEF
ncbi:MAG: D-alanyl-D-alanine carboxypeptidase/D-alanyl-D-alanine-endopeptidase [Candidatus Gastranaerophilales bacterium]|nr:D-alanyl-D-alanine carboxypeptidase/D-alanyl-D-alanine-endopeptidase [Candidatus Gastranaerophilales bacterium]